MRIGDWIDTAIGRMTFPKRPEGQREASWVTVPARLFLTGGPLEHRFSDAEALTDEDGRVRAFHQLLLDVEATTNCFDKLFRLFAYQPEDALGHFARKHNGDRAWATVTELYEALWLMVQGGAVPRQSPSGQRTAAAYLARTRWSLYALAFQGSLDDLERNRIGRDRLKRLAREARDDWLRVLDAIDDYPLLARDIDPIADADALTAVQLDQPPDRPSPRDAEIWRHCVRHHLLPRFRMRPAWRVAWRLSGTWTRRATVIACFTALLALALLVIGALFRDRCFTWGTIVAAVSYLAVAIAAAGERSSSWPWLLRQPAAAAVGLLALTAMDPHWWEYGGAHPGAAVLATVGLVAAAVGYLMVEAINHGVGAPAKSWGQVVFVAGPGIVHAILVSGLALRAVVPIFAQRGEELQCIWGSAECVSGGKPIWIFMLAAGWAFAAGVFIQILWDDQPATAPLAHLGWRTGK